MEPWAASRSTTRKLLRAGDIVKVETAGSVHSGKYLVWSVRHNIGQQSHKMSFQLVDEVADPSASTAPIGDEILTDISGPKGAPPSKLVVQRRVVVSGYRGGCRCPRWED